MKKLYFKSVKTYFSFSVKGWLVFLVAMLISSGVCVILQRISDSDTHVPLIFVLAVLVVALITDGYFYGLLAAVTSVFAVNWAFTYPYAQFNFSIVGYPLTFITMLAVGFAASTLTSSSKAQERLWMESEKEKTRANLLRAISHDLRTPLTTISGSISAVLEDEGGMDRRQKDELLISARKDADWLCRMVENLLSITRINSDSASALNKDEQLLEEVLSEASLNFRKRYPSVSLNVSVPDEILFVPMDAMLIEQVILNLLENSATHGRITDTIWLSGERLEYYAKITVRDNGVGLPEGCESTVFDGSLHFSAAGETDKKRNMGIGLTVCRTIVEAHGGKIWAANSPLGGAEFNFLLPLGG